MPTFKSRLFQPLNQPQTVSQQPIKRSKSQFPMFNDNFSIFNKGFSFPVSWIDRFSLRVLAPPRWIFSVPFQPFQIILVSDFQLFQRVAAEFFQKGFS